MGFETTSPFWLDSCLVDPLEGVVTRSTGDTSHLQNKPMAVLLVLAAASGRVVPSEQIIESVWGPASGGDEGLKRCVHAIRKALGDSSSNPCIIRTVHGRGYACVPVPQCGENPISPSPRLALSSEGAEPPRQMFQSRLVTAVSIILSPIEPLDSADVQTMPAELLKEYLEILESFESAYTFEVGIRSTILFGLQMSKEDDHFAALELAQFIREATQRYDTFCIRIGIATSDARSGTQSDAPKPSSLDTKAIRSAAAIAAAANPGDITLCDITMQLCARHSDSFSFSNSLPYFARTSSSENNEHSPVRCIEMLGRENEFETLRSCWNRVSSGEGLVCFVSGDAGIGKSTLGEMLAQTAIRSAGVVVHCACQSRSAQIPLYPILDSLSSMLGFKEFDSPAEKVHTIENHLRDLGFTDPTVAAVLTEFLQLNGTHKKRLYDLPPGVRRNMLLEILARMLVSSKDQPRLIVIDDMQWADATTLALLDRLVDQGQLAHTMLLVLGRSESHPDWINRPHVTHLNLSPIGHDHAVTIIRHIDKDNSLGADTINRMVEHAAGNPLFIREITKSILASKSSGDSLDGILSKPVQQLLSARVDELGEEKNILIHASIIGYQFSLGQLEGFMSMPRTELEHGLKILSTKNMVHQIGSYPSPTFEFNHSLLQGAVYKSISSNAKKTAHRRLAEMIELSEEQQDRSFLAFHFEAGEQYEKAAIYWLQSANRAKISTLFTEASNHYEKAAAALAKLKPTLERDELKLRILIEYGPVIMSQKGYAHDQVKVNYLLAEKLTGSLAERESAFASQALFGLWSYKVVNGDLHQAKAIGEDLLELALRSDSEELELEAKVLLGVTQTHLGEYDEALDRLQSAILLYDPKAHAHHKYLFGQDPGMAANIYCGLALAQCGKVVESSRHFEQGLILARSSGHANSLCFALVISSRAAMAAGDFETMAFRASEACRLAQASEFPLWLSAAEFLTHAHDYLQTTDATHVYSMLESLKQCQQVGNSLSYLDFASTVANALIDIGDLHEAQRVISDAKSELDRRIKCSDEMAVKSVAARLLALAS